MYEAKLGIKLKAEFPTEECEHLGPAHLLARDYVNKSNVNHTRLRSNERVVKCGFACFVWEDFLISQTALCRDLSD